MNVKFLPVAFAFLFASQIQAHAQSLGGAANGNGIGLTPTFPSLDQWPIELQLEFDPKLPPEPKLDSSQPPRLEIQVLDTYRGPIYQLEIIRQNKGAMLEAIVAALGNRAVIDTPLKRQIFLTGVWRSLTLEGLLPQICGRSAEMWKSTSGTYFFADKPDPTIQKMLDDLRKRKATPKMNPNDPFNPLGSLFKRTKPDPEWGKVPFNGKDVYVIPLPTPPLK